MSGSHVKNDILNEDSSQGDCMGKWKKFHIDMEFLPDGESKI